MFQSFLLALEIHSLIFKQNKIAIKRGNWVEKGKKAEKTSDVKY